MSEIREQNSNPKITSAESTSPNTNNQIRRKANGERGGKPPFNKKNRGNKPFFERPKDDFEEKVVTIRRVTKVTKGGRHFRFAAVVVVGNKKGLVGLGTGKANEVPDAIKKAIKEAKKNLIKVSLKGTSIPHEFLGVFGAGKVLIKPAKEGTGLIAGGPVRAVVELAGIQDVYAKSLGSHTPITMIRAALDGLSQMHTYKKLKELRFGKEEVISNTNDDKNVLTSNVK